MPLRSRPPPQRCAPPPGWTCAPRWSRFAQSGLSTLRYAGDGKFDYDEDLLNMVHVNEDLRASGWMPSGGFSMPPRNPDRNWSKPPSH